MTGYHYLKVERSRGEVIVGLYVALPVSSDYRSRQLALAAHECIHIRQLSGGDVYMIRSCTVQLKRKWQVVGFNLPTIPVTSSSND